MKVNFTAYGFIDVTSQVNLSNGSGMQRGDVLLNHQRHTGMFIGNNQQVEARKNEKTGENEDRYRGGKTGDQTGEEIEIRSYRDYYNYSWDCVLRYVGE